MKGKKKTAARAAAARKKTAPKKVMAKAKAKAKAPAKKKVLAVPAGYRTVTPYLVCRGAAEAIAFYKQAFGAKELMRMGSPDGKVAHAEIRIGDSHVMLGDESPEQGSSAPQTVGGSPVHIFLYLPNVDKVFAQAVAAGATAEMPPMDMFWGDRYCKVSDPFGHKWNMATHIEDVTPKEMARRGQAMMSQQGVGE
jgi:PhnB protein